MKNFGSMMKQAQELQGRMAEMQAEMERTLVEGRSGGGIDWQQQRIGDRAGDIRPIRAQPG